MRRGFSKGFTINEVLIVLCIIALVIIIAIALLGPALFGSSTQKTIQSAHEFAHQLGDTVTGVSCVGRDTNGDGYVTCTIFRKDQNPLSIECARGWTFNSGCKLPKVQMQQGRY